MRRRVVTPTTTRLVALAAASFLLGSPPAAARDIHVVVSAAKFGPIAEARVGDVVVWDNQDIVDHTATSRDGGFDVVLPSGATTRLKLVKVGRFPVICRYHPGMDAMITVEK